MGACALHGDCVTWSYGDRNSPPGRSAVAAAPLAPEIPDLRTPGPTRSHLRVMACSGQAGEGYGRLALSALPCSDPAELVREVVHPPQCGGKELGRKEEVGWALTFAGPLPIAGNSNYSCQIRNLPNLLQSQAGPKFPESFCLLISNLKCARQSAWEPV